MTPSVKYSVNVCDECGASSSSTIACDSCDSVFVKTETVDVKCYHCGAKEEVVIGRTNAEPLSGTDTYGIICRKCAE